MSTPSWLRKTASRWLSPRALQSIRSGANVIHNFRSWIFLTVRIESSCVVSCLATNRRTELRMKIYRLCLVRPRGIAPARNHYQEYISKDMRLMSENGYTPKYREKIEYRYQWDGDFHQEPYLYNEEVQKFPTKEFKKTMITWTTVPTQHQLDGIRMVTSKLPDSPASTETQDRAYRVHSV